MKKIITAVIILFLAGPASLKSFSQQAEGVVKYLTTFDWVKMINACDYLSRERKDRISYMWSNNSDWKMYNNLYFSASRSKYEDSEEKADPDDDGMYNGRKEVFCISRDFNNNTSFDAIEVLGKVYLVSDSLKTPDWKILNDVKEVAGHVCMNAMLKDTLRGQKIIAWFALDIPVKAGPDRFYGLPGLILEVNINNGAKIMTAEKVDMKALTTEFDLPKKLKGKKISGADYDAILKKFLDEKRQAEEFPWGMRY